MLITYLTLINLFIIIVQCSPLFTDDQMFKRVQECCYENGKRINGREQCLAFCRFNTTSLELENQGTSCIDHTAAWMYCAAEGKDNTACCRAKKIPEQCMGFCRGDLSDVCRQRFYDSHYVCIQRIQSILQCHKAAITKDIKWNADDKLSKRPIMKISC